VAAFRATAVRVRVPATSANLGPAFDAAALALALYDDVVLRVSDSGLAIDVAGEGAGALPRTEDHLVVRAARAAFDRLGGQPAGLEVVCANRIPHGRGLGSSAAAICAGILAARAVTFGAAAALDDDATLALAADLEGHPDNVAACLRGGLTLTWPAGGAPRAVTVAPHGDVVPVIFTPAEQVSTAAARRLLPDAVPLVDAASNAGRAALLAVALTTRPDLLLDATDDRLHQPYRAVAMPASADLVRRLRSEGIAAAVSGAGPTVIALTTRAGADAAARLGPAGWTTRTLEVDRGGALVQPYVVAPPNGPSAMRPVESEPSPDRVE
jgi:homoserine kinase